MEWIINHGWRSSGFITPNPSVMDVSWGTEKHYCYYYQRKCVRTSNWSDPWHLIYLALPGRSEHKLVRGCGIFDSCCSSKLQRDTRGRAREIWKLNKTMLPMSTFMSGPRPFSLSLLLRLNSLWTNLHSVYRWTTNEVLLDSNTKSFLLKMLWHLLYDLKIRNIPPSQQIQKVKKYKK